MQIVDHKFRSLYRNFANGIPIRSSSCRSCGYDVAPHCLLLPLQRSATFVIVATRGCRSIPRATQGHATTTIPGDPGRKGLVENGSPSACIFVYPGRTDKILFPTRFICSFFARYSRYLFVRVNGTCAYISTV